MTIHLNKESVAAIADNLKLMKVVENYVAAERERIAELEGKLDQISKQVLFVMEVDLGYSVDRFTPRNGWHPIYHQILWSCGAAGQWVRHRR